MIEKNEETADLWLKKNDPKYKSEENKNIVENEDIYDHRRPISLPQNVDPDGINKIRDVADRLFNLSPATIMLVSTEDVSDID